MVKIGGQPVIETDDSQVLELKLDQNKRLSKEENSKELFKKELVMFGWGSNDYGQLGCGTGIIIKYFFKSFRTATDFRDITSCKPDYGIRSPILPCVWAAS